MARRKSIPSSINADLVRLAIFTFLFITGMVIAGSALFSYLKHSEIFTVKNIEVSGDLGSLDVLALAKLKGQNIFNIDIGKVEAKVQSLYPNIAQLKVLRRLPDDILIQGVERLPFAVVVLDGKFILVSKDGFNIGHLAKKDDNLPSILGVKSQKMTLGSSLADENVKSAFQLIERVAQEDPLRSLVVRSIDVSDAGKIVMVLADAQSMVEVMVNKENISAKIKLLGLMMVRADIQLNDIKYIDLRFDEPVIGRKKAKK